MRITLQRQGYTVLTAPSGEAAVELLRSHQGSIDLLLSDVVLPGMAGHVLASHVRERHPEVKTLFMTGYVENEVLTEARLQPRDLLLKPFTPSVLLERVGAVLAS